MSIFKGAGVALITPFDDNGNVDYDKLKELIEFQIENKTDAIIICGTTGEASTLSDEEQLECIKQCVKFVNGRVPVIAGAGDNNTKTAIYLAKCAEEYGADGLLCVTPYYNKTTQDGLKKYYSSIADSVKIPVIMYNVPSRTGLNITPDTAIYLGKNVSNITAIKEASGNISQVANILSSGCLDVYSGNDDQVVPMMSLGASGVISVVSNIFPKQMHDMVEKYLNGDIEVSRDMQLKMLNVCKMLFCEVNPIPVKKATQILNMTNGILREPLVEMSKENSKVLEKTINDYKNMYN